MDLNYEKPDVEAAKNQFKDQEDRMNTYNMILAEIREIDEKLRQEFEARIRPPQPNDPRLARIDILRRNLVAMNWEGKLSELKMKNDLEKTFKDRRAELEKDISKAALLTSFIISVVPQTLAQKIDSLLDDFDEEPGKQMKAIKKLLEDGMKGDQGHVRAKIVEGVKNLKKGVNEKEIVVKLEQIELSKVKFQRSLKLDNNAGTPWDETMAVTALERITMDNTVAMSVIRDSKKEGRKDFESIKKAIILEFERLGNIKEDGDLEDKNIKNYIEEKDSSVVAMGAVAVVGKHHVGVDLRNICISFNNRGQCNRGDSCHFDHQRTGALLAYPQAQHQINFSGGGNSYQSMTRERSRERDQQRVKLPSFDRGIDRGRDYRGGGDGGNWERSGGGGGSAGGVGYYHRDGDGCGGSGGSNRGDGGSSSGSFTNSGGAYQREENGTGGRRDNITPGEDRSRESDNSNNSKKKRNRPPKKMRFK